MIYVNPGVEDWWVGAEDEEAGHRRGGYSCCAQSESLQSSTIAMWIGAMLIWTFARACVLSCSWRSLANDPWSAIKRATSSLVTNYDRGCIRRANIRRYIICWKADSVPRIGRSGVSASNLDWSSTAKQRPSTLQLHKVAWVAPKWY